MLYFFAIPETGNEIASFSFSSLLFINPMPGLIAFPENLYLKLVNSPEYLLQITINV